MSALRLRSSTTTQILKSALFLVSLHSKCTRALTFENVSYALQLYDYFVTATQQLAVADQVKSGVCSGSAAGGSGGVRISSAAGSSSLPSATSEPEENHRHCAP